MPDKTSFDFETMSSRDRYRILTGTIVPRPIALVTTVDVDGRINAAPISFFNCLSSDPAMLVLGIARRADGSLGDTARNIDATGVFVVNVVSRDILKAMTVCAIPFPAGVNELEKAGLTAVASDRIAAPRIAESPASFECRMTSTVPAGPSRDIILCDVVMAHVRTGIIDDRLHTDQAALDAVGRMGGSRYAFTGDIVEIETPSLAQWDEGRMPR